MTKTGSMEVVRCVQTTPKNENTSFNQGCPKVESESMLISVKDFLHRIHAICVSDNADYFYEHIDETIHEVGLSEGYEGRPPVHSRDIIDIIEGYIGQGYGLSTDEELGELKFTKEESYNWQRHCVCVHACCRVLVLVSVCVSHTRMQCDHMINLSLSPFQLSQLRYQVEQASSSTRFSHSRG